MRGDCADEDLIRWEGESISCLPGRVWRWATFGRLIAAYVYVAGGRGIIPVPGADERMCGGLLLVQIAHRLKYRERVSRKATRGGTLEEAAAKGTLDSVYNMYNTTYTQQQ